MLTIAQFADRTGIAPSALRFYERKGLLLPAQRLENGYRMYTSDQAAEAQLISSLRQADVPLQEIAHFLKLDAGSRAELLSRWQTEMRARLLTMQTAGQYLQGLQPDQPQIHLQRWEERSTLLWFPADAPPEPLPFGPAIAERAKELDRLRIPVLSGGYVRTLDLLGGRLIGEVGFRVELKRKRALPEGARLQEVPITLFATLECPIDDDKAAHRIFRFLAQFGYTPVGFRLERYIPGEADRYQLMIAIMQT